MRDVSVAEAKARLSELLTEVEAGETLRITRRGKPVATVAAIAPAKAPVDLAWLARMTATMTYHDVSAANIVRELRDARY